MEKNNKINKIKEEKGSITVFVLTTMIFLLILIFGIYTQINNKNLAQEKELKKIQQEYENQDINQIYMEVEGLRERFLNLSFYT